MLIAAAGRTASSRYATLNLLAVHPTGSAATPCRKPPPTPELMSVDVALYKPIPQRRESTAPFSFAKVFVELIEPFTELLYGRTASILNQLIEDLLERLLGGVCLVGNDPRRAV